MGIRFVWMRPLGAVLLVSEGGNVTEVNEDVGECLAIGDGGFGLNAGLISRGIADASGIGEAFVCQSPRVAVAADAEDFGASAEVAGRGVVERVVFEGARSVDAETEVEQERLKEFCVRYRNF